MGIEGLSVAEMCVPCFLHREERKYLVIINTVYSWPKGLQEAMR